MMNEEKKNTQKTSTAKTASAKKTSPTAKAKETTKKQTAKRKTTTSTNKAKTTSSAAKKTSTTKAKTTTSKTKSTTTNKNAKTSPKTTTSKKTIEKTSTSVKKPTPKKNLENTKEIKTLETTFVNEELDYLEKTTELEKMKEIKETSPIKETLPKENPKKYFIQAIAITILLLLSIWLWYGCYQNYQEKVYKGGYFNKKSDIIKKIDIDDIKTKITEANEENLFIIFNYRDGKENYELEENLETIIKDYGIKDNVYYVDMTNKTGNERCNRACQLNEELNTTMFKNVPAIAYYRKNELMDIAQREDQKILEASDFAKLLDMYEFQK